MLTTVIISLILAICANARLVSYEWNIGWIQASPDGRLSRPVIAVNGQWPAPTIRAAVGDDLSVTVHNNMPNDTTSIHFHGLHQIRSNQMDGPPHVVACPIPPGSSYTYRFKITEPGTFWWHSHSDGQYVDGLRGPLIISDPFSPYKNKYTDEHVVALSDWYHDLQPQLAACYLSPDCNPSGAEPVPYSALINDGSTASLPVQPGKTYFVRIINMASFAQMYVNFEGHDLTIIEVDGIYTQPRVVNSLYIATGQRYGVLLTAKSDTSKNYAITVAMDTNAFDNVPGYLLPNVTGTLVYDTAKSIPQDVTVPFFNVTDEFSLVPWDQQPALNPTKKITLNLDFFNAFGQNRAGFNGIPYLTPKVPTLYSVLSAPVPLLGDTRIYGNYTNPFVFNYGDVVEITINNADDGQHPLHIHGHQVQLISRSPGTPSPARRRKRHLPPSGKGVIGSLLSSLLKGGSAGSAPIRRDTWTIAGSGSTVIRFVADNPGVWALHCHMEWHFAAGLAVTLIEAPALVQALQKQIDPAMQSICKSQGMATAGNAAGNTKDWLNLDGQRVAP